MPRSRGGTSQRATLQRSLRVAAAVLAVALAVAAVWLIVTAKSTKHAQVGALLGFWSLLMAAFSGLGGRNLRAAEAPVASAPGTDVDVRPVGWLDRIEDAERRAAYERELLQLVRSEIAASLAPELANLRADVAALRGEILETVGGQIRLERIETTRMIGSDLEALQRELRQLRASPEPIAVPVPPVPEPVAASLVPAPEPAEPADPPPYEDDDPFLLLPRIAPYDEPDEQPVAEPAYAGRRRAADEDDVSGGRHSGGDGSWASATPRHSGGRRRRDDDAGHDVLARILQRESPRA